MCIGVLLDRIFIDLVGLFLEFVYGNKYILVFMDYFSKWVEVYLVLD